MTPLRSHTRPAANGAGFTLVEIIVVMLIITVLAGVAIPVAGQAVNREAKKATRAEMQGIDEAVRQYFLDTSALPGSASALSVDPGVPGWSGPYLSGGVDTAGAGATDFDQDGWGVAYRLSMAGDLWTLASNGPDRAAGTTDDVVMAVDVTRERRALTDERVLVINLAIRLYNEDWLSPPPPTAADPLSDTWSTAYTQLVTRGYLPNATEYRTDGWGIDFVRVGSGGPVVAVTSANLGS